MKLDDYQRRALDAACELVLGGYGYIEDYEVEEVACRARIDRYFPDSATIVVRLQDGQRMKWSVFYEADGAPDARRNFYAATVMVERLPTARKEPKQ